nr:hypothetical protein [uncultured Actinoplanes sp.]
MSLDDLFSAASEERGRPQEPEPGPKKRNTVLRLVLNIALIAAATTVTMAALRAGDLSISVVLVAAAFLGLRLIMLAVSLVKAPPLPKRRDQNGSGQDGPAGDALKAAVRRWELTLDRAHSDADLYSRNVLPVLAELTDERLRLRHGITRATDPRRARELLGDPLWAALHDRGRRTPKPRELETYVEALERL